MFKYIIGKVVRKREESVVLENQGIGFEIFCSPQTISQIEEGKEVKLYTFFYLKKEEIELYGFLDEKELEFFKFLNKIQGIGPKTASFFASWKNPEKLKKYLEESSVRVRGIGRKKIQKILLELTGKIKEIQREISEKDKELIEALVALGVSRKEAKKIASQVPPEKDIKERIKIALQMVNK